MTDQHYCGGELVPSTTWYPIGEREGMDILVRVPSKRCLACDREQLSADEAGKLDTVLGGGEYREYEEWRMQPAAHVTHVAMFSTTTISTSTSFVSSVAARAIDDRFS